MAKNQKKVSITQLIEDLKTQTQKYGHFERKGHPGEQSDGTREEHYYEINASTVHGLLGAIDELRGIVGRG